VKIPTILGTTIEMPAPGVAELVLDGQTIRLEPVLESAKDTELCFILRDATSKTTTYGAARFLYTTFPDQGLILSVPDSLISTCVWLGRELSQVIVNVDLKKFSPFGRRHFAEHRVRLPIGR
jgi:Protein of unknown function (DUF1684)